MTLTVMWLSGYCAVENAVITQDAVSGKCDHFIFKKLNLFSIGRSYSCEGREGGKG